jgi:hypothetical protein
MPFEPEIQRAPERPTAPIERASQADRGDDTEADPKGPGSAWFRRLRERFRRAKEYEKERRDVFDLCVRNVANQQWTEKELKNRINRPNPVINMLKQHCDIVLNDMRMNRPGAKVSPKQGSDDSKETAEVIEGMIRDIEYASRADNAYDTADRYQVIGGFSFYGATVDYVSPDSRKKEIRVRRFSDPKAVYMDCDSIEIDGADQKWCFVRQKFTRDQWVSRLGEKARQSFYSANNFFEKDDDSRAEYDQWIGQDEGGKFNYLAEYWEIEEKDRVLVTLNDGTDVWEDELVGDDRNQIDISKEALTKKWPVVTNYLVDGAQIYDETPWQGRYIPIVPEFADELMVDGKRSFFPLPIFALDSQQAINYVAALWIEAMSLIPKGKWHGPVGSFASKNADWQHANTSTVSYLEWDAKLGPNGQLLSAPQFQQPTVDGQGYAIQLQFWQSALMAAIGQYQPSTGAIDPEDRSGKAIDLLQKQGSLATSSFANNSVRAKLHFYKILIDLIPHVYSEEQEVRTIGADDKHAVVWINKEFKDKSGKTRVHDIAKAVRYDAIVDVGQNYHDLRQKAFDFATKIMQADPQLWARIGWLAIKLADLGPLGDQMSKLLEPADVQMQEQQGMDPQTAQYAAMLQKTTQEVQRLSQIIETKKVEEGAKLDRELAAKNIDYRMNQENNDTKVKVALISAKAPIAQAVAEAQIERDDKILGYAHEAGLKSMDMGHEVALNAADAAQGQQTQQSDQQFQAAQNPPEQEGEGAGQ